MAPMLHGLMPILATPFDESGALDRPSLRRLVEFQLASGVDGVAVFGMASEGFALTTEERRTILDDVVRVVDGRIPVIAGTGANSTVEAIHLSRRAKEVGAHAGLSVVPYYNRPTQEGLYRHFKAIVEAVDLPTILYNVPGRSVADMSHDTMLRLSDVPGIIGVKEATGDIGRGALLLSEAPASFQVFSGDDPTAAALMLLGARGNISVTANVAPRMMHDLCAAALAGDVPRVRELNGRLARLNKLLFVEANPIPVKWALAEMGLTALGYRLPLSELSAANHDVVRGALRDAGLL